MQADSIFRILNDARLILLATLILVVLLAYQSSILIWQLIPLAEIESAAPVEKSTSVSSAKNQISKRQKVQQIAQANLFGAVVKQSAAQAPAIEAPDSSLNYKLRGIYYSEDHALASCIVQKNATSTNFYRLGDEIDNQIFIKTIQPDHILISRRGRLEKLSLEKPLANLNSRASSRMVQNRTNPNQVNILKSYKRRYSDNPLALAKRFQAIPVAQNGKNIGYKLKALRGESLLKKMNLQKDDVYVAINGIGLDKPFQALDALKSLTTAESVSLTVIRNGNRETMDFSLK